MPRPRFVPSAKVVPGQHDHIVPPGFLDILDPPMALSLKRDLAHESQVHGTTVRILLADGTVILEP